MAAGTIASAPTTLSLSPSLTYPRTGLVWIAIRGRRVGGLRRRTVASRPSTSHDRHPSRGNRQWQAWIVPAVAGRPQIGQATRQFGIAVGC
jgi:hypothetical protein